MSQLQQPLCAAASDCAAAPTSAADRRHSASERTSAHSHRRSTSPRMASALTPAPPHTSVHIQQVRLEPCDGANDASRIVRDGSADGIQMGVASSSSSSPRRRLLSSLWLLLLCTLVFFNCQVARWSPGVVGRALERSLRFGDGRGGGLTFEALVGPVYSALFGIGGVVVCAWCVTLDRRGRGPPSRTRLLAVNMILAAIASACLGLARSVAQLALARALQGLSQAGAGGFCASLLSESFPPSQRGRALAFYNVGVYGGYGAAFIIAGAFHPDEGSSGHEGWRTMFFVLAAPCALLAACLLTATHDAAWEARRRANILRQSHAASVAPLQAPLLAHEYASLSDDLTASPTSISSNSASWPATPDAETSSPECTDESRRFDESFADTDASCCASLRASFAAIVSNPALLLLCFASAIRTGGGVVWGYNTEQYFAQVWHLAASEVAAYMAWVPVVFGSAGALLGGAAADWLLRHRGPRARIGLLVVAQFIAAPLASGALLLPPPWSFLLYAVHLLVGETYVGACYAVMLDLAPVKLRPLVVAVYVATLANLGGNAGLLLPPVQRAFGGSMEAAMQVLWPGLIALSAMLYAVLWKWTPSRDDLRIAGKCETA